MEGSGPTTEVSSSLLKPSLLLSHEIIKNKLKKIINPIDTFFKNFTFTTPYYNYNIKITKVQMFCLLNFNFFRNSLYLGC